MQRDKERVVNRLRKRNTLKPRNKKRELRLSGLFPFFRVPDPGVMPKTQARQSIFLLWFEQEIITLLNERQPFKQSSWQKTRGEKSEVGVGSPNGHWGLGKDPHKREDVWTYIGSAR